MSYKWVSRRAVEAIHNEQLAQHGGMMGLRDDALLESALARPQNLFGYEQASLTQCAAAYAFGIIRNHPFNDGNKRTGFVVAVTFLLLNGCYITASELEVFEIITRLASGAISEEELMEWFERIIVKL
tara:strand:+ start:2346 stop:2729 length:384 start_codon:yes stop_codon:yes gene_type:complete